MKLRTVFVVTFLGLATLACGGAGGDLAMPSASLTDPWSGLNLPIGDGTVLYSDGVSLSVTYSGGDAAALGAKYDEAMKAAGWSQTFQTSDGSSYTATYGKDGGTISLAVTSSGGTTVVGMAKM